MTEAKEQSKAHASVLLSLDPDKVKQRIAQVKHKIDQVLFKFEPPAHLKNLSLQDHPDD